MNPSALTDRRGMAVVFASRLDLVGVQGKSRSTGWPRRSQARNNLARNNSTWRHGALLALMVFAGAAVVAFPNWGLTQTSTPSAPASATPGGRASHVETRIADLHTKLQITPAQEELWNPVAQAMRENAQTMEALIQARHAHSQTMTAVDDLKSYGDITAAHAEGLRKLTSAFEGLYAGLSDAQKKTADTLFRTRMARRPAATPKG